MPVDQRRRRLDERQGMRLAALREEPQPVAHYDRVDAQVERVDLRSRTAASTSPSITVRNDVGPAAPTRVEDGAIRQIDPFDEYAPSF
jgi:hypothetical protein